MEHSLEPRPPPLSSPEGKASDSWDGGPFSEFHISVLLPLLLHTSLAHADAGSHLGSTSLILANPRAPGHRDPWPGVRTTAFWEPSRAEPLGEEESRFPTWPPFVLFWFLPQPGVSDLCGP